MISPKSIYHHTIKNDEEIAYSSFEQAATPPQVIDSKKVTHMISMNLPTNILSPEIAEDRRLIKIMNDSNQTISMIFRQVRGASNTAVQFLSDEEVGMAGPLQLTEPARERNGVPYRNIFPSQYDCIFTIPPEGTVITVITNNYFGITAWRTADGHMIWGLRLVYAPDDKVTQLSVLQLQVDA